MASGLEWLRVLGVAALPPLLGGCVAVAALPVLAGGAMIAGGNAKIRAATPRPPAQSPRPAETASDPAPFLELTNLTALPPPSTGVAGVAGADPWQRFADFALEQAEPANTGASRKSALLEPGTSLALPRMRACRTSEPAVILDLDPGEATFAARAGAAASPGLAGQVARLRSAGVVVLWLSRASAGEVGEVAEALRGSGLDPEGRDPLLLARAPDERKQVLREEANRDVCVIAIAGDRKGDFDELFDYLRDPRDGESLDFLLGGGWFLTPPPLD